MTLAKLRLACLGSLAVLGTAAALFFQHQGEAGAVGGAISLPKVTWLTTAIFAWFVLPFLLWRDARLDGRVRRAFGLFLAGMAARGGIELVLLYAVGHWSPAYGLVFDLAAIGVALTLWRRTRDVRHAPSAGARAVLPTLALSLVAEIAFVVTFWQSPAAEEGLWFVPSEPGYVLINAATVLTLAFLLPALARHVWRVFGVGAVSRPRFARVRLAGAALLVLVLGAFTGVWTWMMAIEREARQFQGIGYEVVDACKSFSKSLESKDVPAVRAFLGWTRGGFRLEPVETAESVELERWVETKRDLAGNLMDWRDELGSLEELVFKLYLVDEVVSNAEAVARVRFEAVSKDRTDYGVFRWRLRREGSGPFHVVESALVKGTTTRGDGRFFAERARKNGLDFVMEEDLRFVPDAVCDQHACFGPTEVRFQTLRHAYAGGACADVDGDGYDDLFLGAGGRAAFYRNKGDGTFEEATEAAGLPELWHANTAAFADLDGDGDRDLVVGVFYGKNRVFANHGDGTFDEVATSTAFADVDHVTTLAIFDADGDSDLDVYMGRLLDPEREIPDSFLYARNGEENRLLRNDGGFRFTDVTDEAGVGDRGLALAISAADYDADGDTDLYVGNDFGRNVLYRNRGNGTFDEVSKETGTFAIGGSMSSSWGDVNGDGRLDLYVAAIRSNQRWFVQPITARRVVTKFMREGKFGSDNPLLSDLHDFLGDEWTAIGNYALAGNYLLIQNADGTFTDHAERAGARPAGWYWGSGSYDLDNDGDLDLVATDGWITGETEHDL